MRVCQFRHIRISAAELIACDLHIIAHLIGFVNPFFEKNPKIFLSPQNCRILLTFFPIL